MARYNDIYSDHFGGVRTPQRTSLWLVILYILLVVLSAASAIALFIAYLTPYIEPSSFGSLTIVGIFYPILFIVVLMLMMLWLVMRRWIEAAVLAVVLIPGLFSISDFYNVALYREKELPKDNAAFTLMTYNVHGFADENFDSKVDDFVAYFEQNNLPDVVCFQEYLRSTESIERIDSLFSKYNKQENEEYMNLKLVTYSRYPIIETGYIKKHGTTQWCDIVVNKRDTVRIFNNHLYSMSITDDEQNDIDAGRILADGERMATILHRIADNSSLRATHVDTVRSVIAATPYAHIVCGDFNDTPKSYVYRRISKGLNDAFVEQGRGSGYTFRPMHSLLRIDYVLYSNDMECRRYAKDAECHLSDHLPLTVNMKIKK